jgi:hypothetical protein
MRIVYSLAIICCCITFSSFDTQKAATGNVPEARDTLKNELTKAEQAKGWRLLFDGKTMDGWRTYKEKKTNSWEVQDGMLHNLPVIAEKSDLRADLITAEVYDNFELSIDWIISPKGNSGVLYMVQESESSSHLTGPEYQIIDDVNFPQKLEDWQKTGANYAFDPAPSAKPNPAGQWNRTLISVKGNKVEHWLNGKRIVQYTLYGEKWQAAKTAGKFKEAAHYAEIKKGHIALQDHGSEAWFRNIRIRTF